MVHVHPGHRAVGVGVAAPTNPCGVLGNWPNEVGALVRFAAGDRIPGAPDELDAHDARTLPHDAAPRERGPARLGDSAAGDDRRRYLAGGRLALRLKAGGEQEQDQARSTRQARPASGGVPVNGSNRSVGSSAATSAA